MSLTNIQIKNAQTRDRQYKIFDRDGLYLLVKANGRKYWRYEFTLDGKRSTFSMGVYPEVTLAEAREMHLEARKTIRRGVNPNWQKKAEKKLRISRSEDNFKAVALAWHKAQLNRWSEDHAIRVKKQLEARAFPIIGNIPIHELKALIILALLRGMQDEGIGEATFKLKQRISAIFTFAIAEGRIDHNPDQGLEAALAKKPKQKNNPHLTLKQIPQFVTDLENIPAAPLTKLAIKFILHTFVRSTEAREATWDEFDLESRIWIIPAERMKNNLPHSVPLTPQVLEILKDIKNLSKESDYLFPSRLTWRKPFSENTMIQCIYMMGYKGKLTIHGLRGTASTILYEQGFQTEWIEKQLSHVDNNKVRAAYNHAHYLDERIQMMQWYSSEISLGA